MGIDKELQEYYEARFEMFASKGWQDFIDDIQKMREATDSIAGIDDIRKLGIRQGEVSIMDWVLALKQMSEDAYKEITNEDAA